MPELRTCYFCGEVGDGLARRAVVPPELDPDDDQVTVTLCPTCGRKLSNVLEPLVDRARTASSAEQGAAPITETTPEAGTDPAADSGSEGEAPSDPETTPDTETVSAADAGAAGGSDDGTGAGADDATEQDPIEFDPTADEPTVDDTTADEPTADDDAAVGSAVEGSENGRMADDQLDDPLAIRPDDSDAGHPAADGIEGGGDGEGGEDVDGDADEPIDEAPESIQVDPATFRKVMRLLSNREFPVDRAEFVSLAASAYDLDDRTVGAMLDAAVEKDLIGEHDGQLVRD